MASTKYNIKIERGSDWERKFTFRNKATNVPYDLTGCTARMHVRAEVDSPTTLDILTTENGRLLLLPALVDPALPLGATVLGTIQILFPNAVSTAYTDWETGVYQLELIYPSAKVERKLHGSVSLSGEVTR